MMFPKILITEQGLQALFVNATANTLTITAPERFPFKTLCSSGIFSRQVR